MRVVLPWPDKGLSPNARSHWAAKAKLKSKARADACGATYAAVPGGVREARAMFKGGGRIPVRITFYPPDARHRDDDNMVGSFKAARDGIADALGVDDRRFQPHYFFEEPAKPGRVEVVFIHNPAGKSFAQSADSAMKSAVHGGAQTPHMDLNIKPKKEAPCL